MMPILALLAALQQPPIPDVGYERAYPNLSFKRPVAIAHPPDGSDRLFILEQPGRVLAFPNKPDVRKAEVALDITDKVLSRGNEEGLLGIAFHPRFKENGYVFLQYSTPKGDPGRRRNHLSRFQAAKDRTRILPESERLILEVPQPYENHNGGVLQFGPDGFLYIGLGDGGKANDPHENGQKMTTFLGKFLRIDVDREAGGRPYAVPGDNPFVGKAGILPEIWSAGWRNPWGYHFDRKTGLLWSGDVGQDKWEEINIVRRGANYGWNVRESKHPFKGESREELEDPIVEHKHGEANSITGGCVYRGRRLPALDGVYLYGDFVTGNMWGLRHDGKDLAGPKLLFTHPMKQIATFGEDQEGEVYWSSFETKDQGALYRFKLKG